MAAQVTKEEVNAFLTELGYTIPDALLTPILCRVNSVTACMDGAGYNECTQQLILLYAAALMSASSGARQIQSHSAPSGASESFRYGDDAITWLRESLSSLDTQGCTDDLPISAGASVGYFRVVGG